VDKSLREHTLLQAIARVNRLAEQKDFGYIIDYRGVLGELNEALNLYDALADFDPDDVRDTLADVSEQIARLPQLHSDLWAIFAGVANQRDTEAMERHLEPEDRRQRFYECLTDYARTLQIALASVSFYAETPEVRIKRYKDDLKFFHDLRQSIKLRYAESVDYRDYEARVRKLMDEHIRATGVETITQLVNIFDTERFDAEVERLGTPTAKADTILHRMKRTINERIDEDPVFYRKFAELVEETILAYKQGRLDELEYFKVSDDLMQQMRSGRDNSRPEQLARYLHAPAYYGLLRQRLAAYNIDDSRLADAAIEHEAIIESHKVTDWSSNHDVQNAIKRQLDDYFYEMERALAIELPFAELDMLIEELMEVAKARTRLTS
jgi:type I restriction enzyme, R subunit